MGFQVCPLPTAVLSSHTQYPNFSFLDLTDEMPKIIAQWKKLEVQFDAIYTGYLGGATDVFTAFSGCDAETSLIFATSVTILFMLILKKLRYSMLRI